MKHNDLRSMVHGVSDSLASGFGIMVGYHHLDVFGDAARSPNRVLVVDFLRGLVVEGFASPTTISAVGAYRDALEQNLKKCGGALSELKVARTRFWSDPISHRLEITIEDIRGRRSVTEYYGIPAKRAKTLDQLGRIRPKPSVIEQL